MQNEVKTLINHLTSWSGLSGPIPNAAELRLKREQARLASLGATNVLGRAAVTQLPDEVGTHPGGR
jgi:hypothetical protein